MAYAPKKKGAPQEKRELSTSIKIVPEALKYQFEPEYARTHNWSDKCCAEFKHGELAKFERNSGYDYAFIGMRKQEGGNREKISCITKGSRSLHFNVLIPITDEWEEEFIKRYNIELCELYLPPYNFKRTGCMFCVFSEDLQKQLDAMEKINPKMVKQANTLWKTTYDEYRRVGYRLRKRVYNLFDLLEKEK